MKTFVASGRVEKGELKIRGRDRLQREFKTWRDCEVTVLIERKHATRSEAQNRWLWGGILEAISESTGYTRDELHEFFKQQFNAKTMTLLDKQTGETNERVVGQTTTTLNKLEFGEYCEQIRQWAAEHLGLDIPDPVAP